MVFEFGNNVFLPRFYLIKKIKIYTMKKYVITVNGNKYEVEVEEVGSVVTKAAPIAAPAPAPAPKAAPAPASAPKAAKVESSGVSKPVTAPMPGNIINIVVKPGDVVKKGQTLLVFEAMKMENDLASPSEGKVVGINVSKGSIVAAGDVLLTLE